MCCAYGKKYGAKAMMSESFRLGRGCKNKWRDSGQRQKNENSKDNKNREFKPRLR